MSGRAEQQARYRAIPVKISGSTLYWIFEYRPDLDATYPWRFYDSNPSATDWWQRGGEDCAGRVYGIRYTR